MTTQYIGKAQENENFSLYRDTAWRPQAFFTLKARSALREFINKQDENLTT